MKLAQRNFITTGVAEFIGTATLTLTVLAVSRSNIGVPYFVSIAAGIAAFGMLLVLGSRVLVYLNPAITLASLVVRRSDPWLSVIRVLAQLLGAYGAYLLYLYFAGKTMFSYKTNSDSMHWNGGGYGKRTASACL
jgi:glycerol uptake facilitator-like aquaporin